jgi:hypothetical protein
MHPGQGFLYYIIIILDKHNNEGYGLVCTKIRFAFGDSIASINFFGFL